MEPAPFDRHWLPFVLGICAVMRLSPAIANSTGITAYSGKQGNTCSTMIGCHTDTAPKAPVVRFEGSTDVPVQTIATFRFVVHSEAPTTQTYAGFNVAASGGKLAIESGQGERAVLDEITHSTPKMNDTNAEAAFEFTWQAPATAGSYILYGAGNSVNHNFLNTGDKPAVTTVMVNVVAGASPTPTPTATPTMTPAVCTGNCNNDGTVTLDELLIGMEIALGKLPRNTCAIFDVNNDQVVGVDELLQAVNFAISRCPVS